MVDAKGCYIFYGIVPPKNPGDVSPEDTAIALGWVERDSATGEAAGVDGEAYDVWMGEGEHLTPLGLLMDTDYCDGYPLTHIYVGSTLLYNDKEYPLAFSQLPQYTEGQRETLEELATKLGYDSPRWHLGTTPVE